MTGREWLTFEDFAGRAGDPFEADLGAGQVTTLHLAEATQSTVPGGTGPDGRERLQFSLVFRGQPGLPQRTYRLTHADLGELDIFLVPIGPDGEGMLYEAAFA